MYSRAAKILFVDLVHQTSALEAVVSVVEKPSAGESTMAKSQPEGMSHELFFAKAFEAQKAGRISGQEIAIAEAYLNKGQSIPEQIVARVMA